MGSMADCRGPQVALFRCRSVPSRHCAAELQGDPARRQARPNWKAPFWVGMDRGKISRAGSSSDLPSSARTNLAVGPEMSGRGDRRRPLTRHKHREAPMPTSFVLIGLAPARARASCWYMACHRNPNIAWMQADEGEIVCCKFVATSRDRRHCLILVKNRSIKFLAR